MPIFCHEDRSLHYLVRGHGEAVLLIHGLGSSGADWALQISSLEGRFRLIVPDLPGCGHSEPLCSDCNVPQFAASLWALLDHLAIQRPNIIGFSLGGAVALEMALQRPESVPRLVLINSLASYQIDHWRKWLEARVSSLLINLLGMRLTGWLCAARMFPHPWQQPMRERAAAVIGTARAATYLGIMSALEHWTSVDRLERLMGRTLIIAAEHDYTPLTEKRELALKLGADMIVVRGSRHGTPFDAVAATNSSLFAMFSDLPLPSPDRWVCDEPKLSPPLAFAGSLAEQHSLGPCA
jgi:pimeloyl-ACP methyl ester carboxylesterase